MYYLFLISKVFRPSGRTPAYCDRILWLENNKNCDIKIISYTSLSNMLISDHTPVIGNFDMKVFIYFLNL